MLALSYNLSVFLLDSLRKIEVLRRKIILTPLSPKVELRLKFEATLSRLYYSISLSNAPINKGEILKLLTGRKKLSLSQQKVPHLKQAFDYIFWEWLVSNKIVTPKVIFTLEGIAETDNFIATEADLKYILDYVQTSSDNPVILAAISYIQLLSLAPSSDGNELMGRLLAYIFLYKHGYDFRGFLVIEEYFKRNFKDLREIFQRVLKDGKISPWLEYFVRGVLAELEKVENKLKQQNLETKFPVNTFEITDRQREILAFLDQPATTITNRKAQKLFKVSQITASRDLAKLATLGLLFVHGKGRSVYYTRV